MRANHYDTRNLPPNVIPLEQFSARDIRAMGYDPVAVYRMQEELAEMGLGLGFSIGGLIKGIGKGIGKAAGAVAKVAKPVLKTVASATPVGTAIRGVLAVAPNVLAALKKKGKTAETATAADVAQAQAEVAVSAAAPAIAPKIIEEAPASGAAVPAAYFAPHSRSATWNGTAWVEPTAAPAKKKSGGGIDLNKIMELVARTSQAVPQVQQAVESVREAVAPSAPSTSVTVTAPGGGDGGAPPVQAAAGGMPGWLPLAAVGAVALLAFGGRK